jgi:hypothetical protein
MEVDGDRWAMHGSERIRDFACSVNIDVADEAQRDVVVAWFDPTGAEHAAARRRQRQRDLGRNGQRGEETWHEGSKRRSQIGGLDPGD